MSQEGKVRIPVFRDFWTLAGSAGQITVVSVFVFFVFFGFMVVKLVCRIELAEKFSFGNQTQLEEAVMQRVCHLVDFILPQDFTCICLRNQSSGLFQAGFISCPSGFFVQLCIQILAFLIQKTQMLQIGLNWLWNKLTDRLLQLFCCRIQVCFAQTVKVSSDRFCFIDRALQSGIAFFCVFVLINVFSQSDQNTQIIEFIFEIEQSSRFFKAQGSCIDRFLIGFIITEQRISCGKSCTEFILNNRIQTIQIAGLFTGVCGVNGCLQSGIVDVRFFFQQSKGVYVLFLQDVDVKTGLTSKTAKSQILNFLCRAFERFKFWIRFSQEAAA